VKPGILAGFPLVPSGHLTESSSGRYKKLSSGGIMRKSLTIAVAAVTIAASVASADPLLPAGKPAGVGKAQLAAGPEFFVLGGLAALAVGIAVATSGGPSTDKYSLPQQSVVTTTGTAV
jgi:hypothetical protein